MKTVAFVMVVKQGEPSSHVAAIGRLDAFRTTWESYANGAATGGRGKFDTSLDPAVH